MLLFDLKFRSFLTRCALHRKKNWCPHMAVASARWPALYRWCRVLRGRLTVEYKSEPSQQGLHTRSRFHSLVLTLDESEKPLSVRKQRKIRDAMELVLLALSLDPHNAWEQVVRVLCGTPNFFPTNHLRQELVPRLCVRHVLYGTFRYDTIDVYSAMWATADPTQTARSGAYQRTRKWLVSNFGGSTTGNTKDRRSIRTPLTLHFSPTLVDMARGSVSYLARTVELVKTLCSDAKRPSPCSMMQLESLELDLRALDMDPAASGQLRELQQTRIRIDKLFFAPMGVCGSTALLNDPENAIQSLVLGGSSFSSSSGLPPPTAASSWWHALCQASGVKHLEIDHRFPTGGALPSQGLPALTSLLDPRSGSRIESVRFHNGSLSQQDIAAMNQLLLTAQEPHEPHDPKRPSRLRRFQLSVSPQNDHELGQLLVLLTHIGQSLEVLTLDLNRYELKAHHVSSLCKACVNLKRLCLQRTELATLDFLVSESQQGNLCLLESLVLEDTAVNDKQSLLTFVRCCNDKTSGFHQKIKDFVYDNYLHEGILAELLPLLEANTTLRHIGLRVTSRGMARQRARLKKLHLAPLPVDASQPLPMESKLAFLLCVTLARPIQQQQEQQLHLNGDVCRHIVAFAGECERRRLVCLVYDWIRLHNRFEI